MKRYAVWGIDKTYRCLWIAALAAGITAFKKRYSQGKEANNDNQA